MSDSRGTGPIDRSDWPVRVSRLHDEQDEIAEYAHLTPGQRIDRVDELTRTASTLYTGSTTEPESRRDVVRVFRRER